MSKLIRTICAGAALFALLMAAAGCAGGGKTLKLDPNNPVTITIWHYYNGAVLNAFDAAVAEFNDTVGMEQGVIVEILGFGNPNELEGAVMASAGNEIGSMPIPNIFATYADTAYAADRLGLLANLSEYFTEDELGGYIDSYIDEGRIGQNGELRIMPVAKSTEVLMINETDWLPFANEYGLSYSDIATMEGITGVAEQYYGWSGGKAFFGRDSRANMFIIATKSFGIDFFDVSDGGVTVNADRDVLHRIWNGYYIPYINGYFTSYGRFSSDDARVGDILAYVGSTSSAAYFPAEVTTDRETYPVTAAILPAPLFEGGEKVLVQQGAGMAVTNSTPEAEYASCLFLKWFTDIPVNINFASLSGYMPVKKDAMDYDLITSMAAEAGITLNTVTDATLRVAIDDISRSGLYTSKAFAGGAGARAVLENNLQDKAIADRAEVLSLIDGGMTREEAVAQFDTDANFENWYSSIVSELNKAAAG